MEKARNRKIDDESGKQVNPVFNLELREPGADTREALSELRFELSERVRRKELFGFVDIGPNIYETTHPQDAASDKRSGEVPLRYQTNSPTFDAFPAWLASVVSDAVEQKRTKEPVARLSDSVPDSRTKELIGRSLTVDQLNLTLQKVAPVTKGLSIRTATGEIVDGPDDNKIAAFLVPLGLMMLMFMMVLVGATPLMQGVVEEKMQRIAEVLLGSVQPFELMMGKLLGMTGVSLTLATIYLGGTYAAAVHFEFAKHITIDLLCWFVLFQILATMMFGSLFIAVGAACSDLRETQNLLWPVMLLAIFPMFVLVPIVTEPNSPFAIGASFFPFATPTLMMARLAVPPSIPYWQPAWARSSCCCRRWPVSMPPAESSVSGSCFRGRGRN